MSTHTVKNAMKDRFSEYIMQNVIALYENELASYKSWIIASWSV